MLPPYVIGCTAGDVCMWRWRYITLCEQEENKYVVSAHVWKLYILQLLCSACRLVCVWVDCNCVQPDGFHWMWFVLSVCAVYCYIYSA